MSTINTKTLFGCGGNAHFLLFLKGSNFPGQSQDLHVCFRVNQREAEAYMARPSENQVSLHPLYSDIKNNPWDSYRLINIWLRMLFGEPVPEIFSQLVKPEWCFALQGDDMWSYNLVIPATVEWRGLYASSISNKLYLLPSFSEESLPHLFPQRTWLLDLVQKGFDHIRTHMK